MRATTIRLSVGARQGRPRRPVRRLLPLAAWPPVEAAHLPFPID